MEYDYESVITRKIEELKDEIIEIRLEKKLDYETATAIKLVQIETLQNIIKEVEKE